MLQMRPHFIYNALMSIYYLCAQKPQKVQEVTLDFMTYLRKNFTALAGEDTISFSDELEHTRAYLLIEQVQFEDNEYYYYVKAIPKITVSKTSKSVKKINSQSEKKVRVTDGTDS